MSTANALDDSLVMMKLGDYRFALSTAAYQAFDRDTAWRWPGVERIGGTTRPQFVGPGDDTIRLAGIVYPHFAGAGLGQIDAMRAEAAKGLPLRMVCGRGKFWGRWVVTSLTERQAVFWSNGAPRRQDFELSLSHYDDGSPQTLRAEADALAGNSVRGQRY